MDAMAMASPQRTTSVVFAAVKAAGLRAGISGMKCGLIVLVHTRVKKKQTKSVENMHNNFRGHMFQGWRQTLARSVEEFDSLCFHITHCKTS